MSTLWSVLLNRIDNTLGKAPWKEWRVNVITQSEGAPSAGAIPMLGLDGRLDPSMVSGGEPASITLMAGTSISPHQIISIRPNGNGYPADATTLLDAGAVVGIAISGATMGNEFILQQAGNIISSDFNFTVGVPLYLGLSGALVESLPAGAVFQQPVGITTTSTSFLLEIGLPIVLAN